MIYKIIYTIVSLLLIISTSAFSQTNPVINVFPQGTTLHGNIDYSNDTLRKHCDGV